MVKVSLTVRALMICVLTLSGCGYATKPNLPDHIKSVYVAPVKNAINLTGEINEREAFKVYRPGLEVELQNAIINRYILDGYLKIGKPEVADAVLSVELKEYRRDPLRYSDGDDVQEYRLNIIIHAQLKDRSTDKPLWESDVVGDATYYLQGPRAESEDQAIVRVVEDVARRVVEYTLELW